MRDKSKKIPMITTLIFLASLSVAVAEISFETILRSWLSNGRPLTDVLIVYETGTYFGDKNKLQISGDGTIALERVKAGVTERFQNKLTPRSIHALLNEMLESRIWTVPPADNSLRGDADAIQISVSTQQKDFHFVLATTGTNAILSPQLHTTIKIFEALMKEVSKSRSTL